MVFGGQQVTGKWSHYNSLTNTNQITSMWFNPLSSHKPEQDLQWPHGVKSLRVLLHVHADPSGLFFL